MTYRRPLMVSLNRMMFTVARGANDAVVILMLRRCAASEAQREAAADQGDRPSFGGSRRKKNDVRQAVNSPSTSLQQVFHMALRELAAASKNGQ